MIISYQLLFVTILCLLTTQIKGSGGNYDNEDLKTMNDKYARVQFLNVNLKKIDDINTKHKSKPLSNIHTNSSEDNNFEVKSRFDDSESDSNLSIVKPGIEGLNVVIKDDVRPKASRKSFRHRSHRVHERRIFYGDYHEADETYDPYPWDCNSGKKLLFKSKDRYLLINLKPSKSKQITKSPDSKSKSKDKTKKYHKAPTARRPHKINTTKKLKWFKGKNKFKIPRNRQTVRRTKGKRTRNNKKTDPPRSAVDFNLHNNVDFNVHNNVDFNINKYEGTPNENPEYEGKEYDSNEHDEPL